MNPKLKKTLKIFSNILVVLVVVLTILLYGVRLFGLELYTVLSPSMEPNFPTGSLIYVSDIDPSDLRVDDVITFRLTDNMTATHRIIEIVPDENDLDIVRFRTKGDNNNIPDGSLVEFDDVIGKPTLCIPLLGYLAVFLQNPPGSVITIVIGIALILVVIIIDNLTDDKNKKKSKKDLHKGDNSL